MCLQNGLGRLVIERLGEFDALDECRTRFRFCLPLGFLIDQDCWRMAARSAGKESAPTIEIWTVKPAGSD